MGSSSQEQAIAGRVRACGFESGGDAETAGLSIKAAIESAEAVAGEAAGCQQAHIDPAEPAASQAIAADELKGLFGSGAANSGQPKEERECLFAVPEIAACEFADDVAVRRDPAGFEQLAQARLPAAEVVHPGGRMNSARTWIPPSEGRQSSSWTEQRLLRGS